MILENYVAFDRAKRLGFIQNPVTKLWDSPNSIVIKNPKFEELGFNIGKIQGSFEIRNAYKLKTLKGLETADCNSFLLFSAPLLESLDFFPKFTDELQLVDCISIKNLKGLNRTIDLIISGCSNLTSLEGIPNMVENIFIKDAIRLPLIEEDFAVHIGLHGFKDYHLDLLKFAVQAKRENELKDVNFPEEFKKDIPELIRSAGGLNKFNI